MFCREHLATVNCSKNEKEAGNDLDKKQKFITFHYAI